jgi:phage gp36-like protein
LAYATQSDLQNRLTTEKLVQLTDFDATGEIAAARVQEALDAASADIDSYASGRYAAPLAASKQVNDLCLRITIYRLYLNRQRPVPPEVQKDRDDAMALLKDVAAGNASLDQPAAVQTSKMDVVQRNHSLDPETFDENKLGSF